MRKHSKKIQIMLLTIFSIIIVVGIAVGIYFAVKGKNIIPNPSPNGPPTGGGGTIVGPVTPPTNNVKQIQLSSFTDICSGAIFNPNSNISNASIYLNLKSVTSTKGNTNKPFMIPLIAFGNTSSITTSLSNIIVLTNKISPDITPTNQMYLMSLYFVPTFKKQPSGSPTSIDIDIIRNNWDYIVENSISNSTVYIQDTGSNEKDFGINVNIIKSDIIPYNVPLGIVVSQNNTNAINVINSFYITNNSSNYSGFKSYSQTLYGFNNTIYAGNEIINSSEYHYELSSNTALQLVTSDSNETTNFINYSLSQPLN